jgi:hypothetical protein
MVGRLLALTAIGSLVFASGADATQPRHWRGHDTTTVILHHGNTQFDAIAGDNNLDDPRVITCGSLSGCLISFSAIARVYDAGATSFSLCSMVDGADVEPPCWDDQQVTRVTRQSMHVTQGEHTIQTVIRSTRAAGIIYEWEADYTIYEGK